jgi:hypothetical protein
MDRQQISHAGVRREKNREKKKQKKTTGSVDY